MAIIWATTGLEPETTEGANLLISSFYHWPTTYIFYFFDLRGHVFFLLFVYYFIYLLIISFNLSLSPVRKALTGSIVLWVLVSVELCYILWSCIFWIEIIFQTMSLHRRCRMGPQRVRSKKKLNELCCF